MARTLNQVLANLPVKRRAKLVAEFPDRPRVVIDQLASPGKVPIPTAAKAKRDAKSRTPKQAAQPRHELPDMPASNRMSNARISSIYL